MGIGFAYRPNVNKVLAAPPGRTYACSVATNPHMQIKEKTMPQAQIKEGQRVPQVTFRVREDNQWKSVTTDELFDLQ